MNKLFKTIGIIKVYFSNATMYMFVATFIMSIATVKQVYGVPVKACVILPIAIIGVLLLGYLDYKLITKHQITHLNKMNDIKQQLDEIETLLKHRH